jgi:chromosome segregation ATPase
MTKSGTGSEESKTGAPPAKGDGPSPELVEQFRQFEARVDEAVRLIAKLKQDRQRLEAKLDEASQTRAEAVRRIDALIDKIDGLL